MDEMKVVIFTFSRPSGVCEMMRSALKFSWSTDDSPLASSAHDDIVFLTRVFLEEEKKKRNAGWWIVVQGGSASRGEIGLNFW
jgi:hypothetical protein